MGAWLVTWEWEGNHARVKNSIAAIVNYRRSSEQVREIVELIYANETYSLSERLAYAKNKKRNPYPASYGSTGKHQWSGEIYCGHNPWLFARLVDELHVEVDRNGKEKLTWQERPKPKLKWLEHQQDV